MIYQISYLLFMGYYFVHGSIVLVGISNYLFIMQGWMEPELRHVFSQENKSDIDTLPSNSVMSLWLNRKFLLVNELL